MTPNSRSDLGASGDTGRCSLDFSNQCGCALQRVPYLGYTSEHSPQQQFKVRLEKHHEVRPPTHTHTKHYEPSAKHLSGLSALFPHQFTMTVPVVPKNKKMKSKLRLKPVSSAAPLMYAHLFHHACRYLYR